MSTQRYTTNILIESAKRRASIPTSQDLFTPADFIAFANEEMSLGLLPSVLRLHEDYLMYTLSIPLEQNKSRYDIPTRAIGNKLREISFKDINGNIFEMTRINVEDLADYNGPFQQARQYAFYVENSDVVLVPGVGNVTSGSLEMTVYLRPNELVAENQVGTITSINFTTGDITIDATPNAFSTTQTYDLIKATSPFKSLALDKSATAVNSTSNTINFAPADIPSTLSVGDYVCLAGESIIPQIPQELHPVLAHRVASRCLEAMGDTQGLQNANSKLAEMEQNLTALIDNRVEGSPHKVVNRHSQLRQGMFRRRYRYKG